MFSSNVCIFSGNIISTFSDVNGVRFIFRFTTNDCISNSILCLFAKSGFRNISRRYGSKLYPSIILVISLLLLSKFCSFCSSSIFCFISSELFCNCCCNFSKSCCNNSSEKRCYYYWIYKDKNY